MRSSRRIKALIVLAGLAALGACSSREGPYFGRVKPPEGQILRYVSGTEPGSMDPQIMTGQPESRIAVALFDGLFEYEETTMNPRPSLAVSHHPNADGTVWVFNLRRDATWTDLLPVTAHDFVYSWRRALDPETAAPYASLLYPVLNGKAFNEHAAFVRDPASGRYATEADLDAFRTAGAAAFTGDAPRRFDLPPHEKEAGTKAVGSAPASSKLLLVPADEGARDRLLNGDPARNRKGDLELARFLSGKEIVPVTKEHVGVRATDDYTFEVTLEAPTAYFLKLLYHQFFRAVPRQAIEKHGNALWTKPGNIVTSGAFKLAEWRPYERIVVVRNETFWDNANTRLDKIIFPAIEQLTTAMNLYKAGEIDCTQSNEVPPPWRRQLRETKKDFRYGPYIQIEALAIKTTQPPLTDVRVRRALSLAINRSVLADQSPGRVPSASFVPHLDGYENAGGEIYNPDRARQLLAEAGFPGGKGFPELEILYNTAESNKQTQEMVQEMLRQELGITVRLTNKEWRAYLQATRANRLDFNGFARWAWIGDFVDPYTFLETIRSDSENNRSGWKDVKYDRMLDAANAEIDQAKRYRMLHDAEAYMIEHQPLIPLFVGPSSFLCKPYVKNLVPNLLDQHDWRGVYIDHAVAAESPGISLILSPIRFGSLLLH